MEQEMNLAAICQGIYFESCWLGELVTRLIRGRYESSVALPRLLVWLASAFREMNVALQMIECMTVKAQLDEFERRIKSQLEALQSARAHFEQFAETPSMEQIEAKFDVEDHLTTRYTEPLQQVALWFELQESALLELGIKFYCCTQDKLRFNFPDLNELLWSTPGLNQVYERLNKFDHSIGIVKSSLDLVFHPHDYVKEEIVLRESDFTMPPQDFVQFSSSSEGELLFFVRSQLRLQELDRENLLESLEYLNTYYL